jgi:para-nitrobenzyl esterase
MPDSRNEAPHVTIESGRISGLYDEEIAVFKGIPFAAPPVGDLRWKPPQPVQPWDGLRPADTYGPIAIQPAGDMDLFFKAMIEGHGVDLDVDAILANMPAPEESEDCLYLNVRTPDLGPEAKLPVMVWIHGGGHQSGSGSESGYQTNTLPKKGVVLVTINYRLGIMGYFAHPDLNRESGDGVSGNYGTLDQIAALSWVKRNITAFGGDPDNVTIFGESAGGESVSHMVCSPLARGLFARAIMQSPCTGRQMVYLDRPFLNFQPALTSGQAFAAEVTGSGAAGLEDMRRIPAKKLVEKAAADPKWDVFYPVIDGHVLAKSPFAAFLEGEQAPVPLLLGANADEGTLLFPFIQSPLTGSKPQSSGPEGVQRLMREEFGEDADQLMKLYPGLKEGTLEAQTALLGDNMFNHKTQFYALNHSKVGQPAYLYVFSRTPPSPRQTIGAYHGAEIPFVFDGHWPIFPGSEKDGPLTQAMGEYWANFAKTGDPNGASQNGSPLPVWPRFLPENQQQMNLGYDLGAVPASRADKFDILDRRLLKQIEGMKTLEGAQEVRS